jgi:hypothetical protein
MFLHLISGGGLAVGGVGSLFLFKSKLSYSSLVGRAVRPGLLSHVGPFYPKVLHTYIIK